MESRVLRFLSITLFLMASAIFAQNSDLKEEMIVFASKSETPLDQFGASVTVITAEDIERHQWRTVSEVLHFQPGVSFARTGGDGGLTTLFLRGANSQDTLVLLNGVKLNDASGVSRGFDFAHLSTAGVARIELVLGPQSTLYGSDAGAGVVNIVMKAGAEPRFSVNLEASDEDSVRGGFAWTGNNERVSWSAGVDLIDSSAISARVDQPFGSTDTALEEDSHQNINAFANLDFALGEQRRFKAGVTWADSQNDIDASNGDDPNYTSDYTQTALHAQFEDRPQDGRWSYSLHMTRSQTDRADLDLKNEARPSDAIDSDFKGVNLGFEFRNTFDFNENTRLIAGVSLDREEGQGDTLGESLYGPFTTIFDENADILAGFAQIRWASEHGFHTNVGGRYDDHSEFGSHGTWQAAMGYRASTGTNLRAFYGTGYRAPSIFQLFSSFGNTTLTEEESDSLEIGLGQDLLENRLRFELVWFDNTYNDLIDFGFNPDTGGFTYVNLPGETRTDGYEFSVAWQGEGFQAKAAWEELDAERDATDFTGAAVVLPLIRRLNDKGSLMLSGQAWRDARWHLDVLHYGESLDTNFTTFANETLDAYTLVNLGLQANISDAFTLSARVDNATDEDYVQVIGYGVYGRRFFLGLRYNF